MMSEERSDYSMWVSRLQKVVLREFHRNGGFVTPDKYFGDDSTSDRDAEYGIKISVVHEGASLSTVFPLRGFVDMAVSYLMSEDEYSDDHAHD